VLDAYLRAVLDADEQPHHPEPAQLARELRGQGVGAALADQPRLADAAFVERGAQLAQAREGRLGSRQEQRVVVEAEHSAAAGRVPQRRHLVSDRAPPWSANLSARRLAKPEGVDFYERCGFIRSNRASPSPEGEGFGSRL
jgi:hypothetical protein